MVNSRFLDQKGISKIYGKQFRYILPLNKNSRKLLKKSSVKWNINYPKDSNLHWDKSTLDGRKKLNSMPDINSDMTEYNTKNINAHKKDIGTLEAFL